MFEGNELLKKRRNATRVCGSTAIIQNPYCKYYYLFCRSDNKFRRKKALWCSKKMKLFFSIHLVFLMFLSIIVAASQNTTNTSSSFSSSNSHGGDAGVILMEIHPTSALLVERRLKRQRQRKLPDYWFDQKTNAVYATIPKIEDFHHNHSFFQENDEEIMDTDELKDLQDFHSYRHLSRYERQYRLQNGFDLQRGWDGVYSYTIEEQEKSEKTQDSSSTASNPTNDDDYNNHNSSSSSNTTNVSSSIFSRHFRRQREVVTSTTSATPQQLQRQRQRQRQKQKQQSYSGGYFNNYQAVPVSQGYGTHYANVWVGSPTPQRKTAIVDTGSHYTAFPCTGCIDCGAKHHTDPYFDPNKSNSFHPLTCNECYEEQQVVTCKNSKCFFSQSYTEGSSWEAYQVKDKFYCSGMDILGAVDPNDQKYTIDFMFGCQTSSTGLFITQLADGIMGMSAHETTLPKQLYNKRKIEHNLFALCFRRELGSSKRGVTAGIMTLGGVSNSLDTSPMIYAKNIARSGFYTVYVKNIYIRKNGGQSAKNISSATAGFNSNSDNHNSADDYHQILKVHLSREEVNSGKGVIVDSGTTDTYLNKNMFKSFNKMWKKVTGKGYSHTPMKLTAEQLRILPTILIQCDAYDLRPDPSKGNPEHIVGYVGKLDPNYPTDLLIAIPATNYMEYSPRTGLYSSRLYFTETNGGVLGSNTMQGHNVVFDWENSRIGFAESSCTYDKDNMPQSVPSTVGDDNFASDCIIGKPILSEKCFSTIDERLCRNNPSNVMLLGTEIWTMVVESPGTESGLSCAEAASQKLSSTKARSIFSSNYTDGPSMIHCDGNGLCHEHRPCEISCSEIPKTGSGAKSSTMSTTTTNTNTPSSSNRAGAGCGDSFWSACDYNCTQSRIGTSTFTDGICYEISRAERPCHKDACGRSDPCRVPFIVHAILAFRGVPVSQWTRHAEDALVEAFTKVIHALSDTNDKLFDVGDVSTHLPRPWIVGDDDTNADANQAQSTSISAKSDADSELGLKITVEVSIFNPSASFVPPRQAQEAAAMPAELPVSTLSNTFNNNATTFKFKEMMSNITALIQYGRDASKTTCQDSDLYSLATGARKVAHQILGRQDFMTKLIEEMKASDGLPKKEMVGKNPTVITNASASIFRPVYVNARFARESRLVSSWTIRTDVDENINYYGPPEPLHIVILHYIHQLAFTALTISIIIIVWGSVSPYVETLKLAYNDSRHRLPGLRGNALYRLIYESDSGDSEDDDKSAADSNGTGDLSSPARSNSSNHRIRRRMPGSPERSIRSIEMVLQRQSSSSLSVEQWPLHR